MTTRSQLTDLKTALPHENSSKPYLLVVSDGQLAKDGDNVLDTRNKMEGVLNFGLWFWTITWFDGVQTIVVDPSLLELKL